jgi:hypothetical protein
MGFNLDSALCRIALARATIIKYQLDPEGDHLPEYTDFAGPEGFALRFAPAFMSRVIAHEILTSAVTKLSAASDRPYVPHALITSAWDLLAKDDTTGAQAHLDEAWDIAERGPMWLHLTDIHLYRARLFFREQHYPWKSPQDDLAAAEDLINECGYHRRDEELADAKRAILGV